MMNTHLFVFALQLFVPVHDFKVFDVGANKKKINVDDTEFQIAKNLPNRIRMFGDFLDSELKLKGGIRSPKIHLAIPGFILETLKKNHSSDFALLKKIVLEHNVEFLLSTFYNTSLKVSCDKDLAGQLLQEKSFIKKNFAQKADLFFTNDHHISKKVSLALKRSEVKGILFANNSYVSLLHYTNTTLPVLDIPKGNSKIATKMHTYSFLQLGNENIRTELRALFADVSSFSFVSCSNLFSHETSQLVMHEKKDLTTGVESNLQAHLTAELQMMYPHILNAGDEELLKTWRLLANKELLSYANPELASQDHNPYEYYANVMHVLNDMAHTIVSVENVRRNKPQISATIYPSPSAFVQEQLINIGSGDAFTNGLNDGINRGDF